MVICDGVLVIFYSDKCCSFVLEIVCFKGEIDKENLFKIDWCMFDYLMGFVCYCMVVVGDKDISKIYFVGGLINLYNYNGIGYNGEFLIVDDVIWIFDIVEEIWVILKIDVEVFIMDYCGLINVNGFWSIIGGMFGV